MTRFVGTAIVLAALRGQRRIPYLPRATLDALRDRRIRRLVSYAARSVPFYRNHFRDSGIDARDIRGARDLEGLPLLDRNLVRQQPELFRSTARRARGAMILRTSGSTGTPLEVPHDQRSLLENIAYGERERSAVLALTRKGFRPKELYLGFETSNFRAITDFYAASTWLPRPQRTTVSMIAPFEEIVAAVNRVQPDILVGYGGFLDDFYRMSADRGVTLHRPRVVMYVGERLPPERRAWIEHETGARVLSRYSAVEALKVGYFCEERSGFHVHEDLCHLRVVGSDGRRLPAGEAGQLVISNLVNHAAVLLNYPMGDIATLSDTPCACGRTQQLLSEIEGRLEDMLVLPGGRALHPRAVWAVVKAEREVRQYQFIQHALDRFELRLVVGDEATLAEIRDRLVTAFRAVLGPDARIDVARHIALGEVERGTTGKFRAVERRMPK